MQTVSRDQYLEAKVMAAPSPRLHLMLVEAAIRRGRQAEEALRSGDSTASDEPMMKIIEIVGELLAGVRGQKTDLNNQIADIYWFIFRLASEAKINNDPNKLAEALKLLEFERKTWQLACDKLSTQTTDSHATSGGNAHVSPPRPTIVARAILPTSPTNTSGISLEA
jgi:flagellar secretion chaperone FliS